jgi:hypothetical protein
MPISKPNKQLLIRSLQATRNKGDELEIELLIAGRDAEAGQVREATDRLSKQIRRLITAAKKSWRGQADALLKDMKKRNASLQAAIRDIKKKIKIAENVVKAVGFVDDAVEVAAKALAPL